MIRRPPRSTHCISSAASDVYKRQIKSFFELDDEKKIKYYFPELYGQRGYVVKGQEHAKGSSKGDLKEFFHIGNPAISNPKNIWPIEVNDFEEIGTNAFLTLENIEKFTFLIDIKVKTVLSIF